MRNVRGFSLIEMIVVLLLMGILAIGAGFFLVNGVQSYMLSSKNSSTTLKVQNALDRLTLELRNASGISAPIGSGLATITYDIVDLNEATGASVIQRDKTITAVAGFLTITGYRPYTTTKIDPLPLIDGVQTQNFTVSVVCSDIGPSPGNEVQYIDLSLTVDDIPNVFTTKVYPRGLLTCP